MTPFTSPTILAIFGAMALCVQPLLAQTKSKAPAMPRFEVASVRPTPANAGPAAGQDRSWGEDSGRVVLRRIPLKFVLLEAYGLRDEQVHGPGWLDDLPFDIVANAPAGTPKAQIRLMMQALLEERFRLKFHREAENRTVTVLTVRKEGHLLKEVVPGFTSSGPLPEKNSRKTGGAIIVGMAKSGKYKLDVSSGGARYEYESITMPQFAEVLSKLPGWSVVVDGTGLKGAYQLTYELDKSEVAPALVQPDEEPSGILPIPEQLKKMGLELVRQRMETEKFVIDSIERTPAAN